MNANKRKKVMIALDYDPTAQKVAEVGYSLAKSMEAEIILLHVISDPVYYSSLEYSPIMGFTGYVDTLQHTNLGSLKEATLHYLEKTRNHLADETIKIVVKEGILSETILETAKELKVDIIVMGSHSRKWLENIIMGSATEKVLNNTTTPLFIVPTKQNK